MLDALEGREHRCAYRELCPVGKPDGRYCYAPLTYRVTLGEIAERIYSFKEQPQTLVVPSMAAHSFETKLYSAYLSYLPEKEVKFPLLTKSDYRGSFTELIKTLDYSMIITVCR